MCGSVTGVPHLGVDAVEDAGERVAPVCQRYVHAASELRREDLPGVVRRHRDDRVGKREGTGERVGAAPPFVMLGADRSA